MSTVAENSPLYFSAERNTAPSSSISRAIIAAYDRLPRQCFCLTSAQMALRGQEEWRCCGSKAFSPLYHVYCSDIHDPIPLAFPISVCSMMVLKNKIAHEQGRIRGSVPPCGTLISFNDLVHFSDELLVQLCNIPNFPRMAASKDRRCRLLYLCTVPITEAKAFQVLERRNWKKFSCLLVRGDFKGVNQLVYRRRNTRTLLDLAVGEGDIVLLNFLLTHFDDLDPNKGSLSATPFQTALERGDQACALRLLEHPRCLMNKDQRNEAFHLAAIHDQTSLIIPILAKGSVDVNACCTLYQVLALATKNAAPFDDPKRLLSMINILLSLPLINPNHSPSHYVETPLKLAISLGEKRDPNFNVFHALIQHPHINIDLPATADGMTHFEYALIQFQWYHSSRLHSEEMPGATLGFAKAIFEDEKLKTVMEYVKKEVTPKWGLFSLFHVALWRNKEAFCEQLLQMANPCCDIFSLVCAIVKGCSKLANAIVVRMDPNILEKPIDMKQIVQQMKRVDSRRYKRFRWVASENQMTLLMLAKKLGMHNIVEYLEKDKMYVLDQKINHLLEEKRKMLQQNNLEK